MPCNCLEKKPHCDCNQEKKPDCECDNQEKKPECHCKKTECHCDKKPEPEVEKKTESGCCGSSEARELKECLDEAPLCVSNPSCCISSQLKTVLLRDISGNFYFKLCCPQIIKMCNKCADLVVITIPKCFSV